MKRTILILTLLAAVAGGCTSKKASFDYSELPSSWTELTISGDDRYVCRSADKFTIEGDSLIYLHRGGYDKSDYEIADANQRGDTMVFDLKWTDRYSGRLSQFEWKYLWFDREREILIKITDHPNDRSYYIPDGRVSEYRTVTCHDEIPETLTVETDSTFVSSIRPDETLRLGDVYTDIFEYLGYDDEGDDYSVTLRKGDVVLSMIANGLYYEELPPDWRNGKEYMIDWKIDTMRPAGDESQLWLVYFAEKAMPIDIGTETNYDYPDDVTCRTWQEDDGYATVEECTYPNCSMLQVYQIIRPIEDELKDDLPASDLHYGSLADDNVEIAYTYKVPKHLHIELFYNGGVTTIELIENESGTTSKITRSAD